MYFLSQEQNYLLCFVLHVLDHYYREATMKFAILISLLAAAALASEPTLKGVENQTSKLVRSTMTEGQNYITWSTKISSSIKQRDCNLPVCPEDQPVACRHCRPGRRWCCPSGNSCCLSGCASDPSLLCIGPGNSTCPGTTGC